MCGIYCYVDIDIDVDVICLYFAGEAVMYKQHLIYMRIV